MTNNEKPSVKETAKDQINLGAINTAMAADRTLMAWIRTSLSMFTFSFALYKILQQFQTTGKALGNENTPRNVGLFLAVAGTMAMVMGTIEYCLTLQQLRALQRFRFARAPFIMALLMCVAGVFLCISIMTNLF